MRALVITGAGAARVEEVEAPVPGAGGSAPRPTAVARRCRLESPGSVA
jgi:hypothetical protein